MTTNITVNPLDTGVDELERYALEECVKRQRLEHRVSALVISDKRCELSVKLARLGANVRIGDAPENQGDIEGRVLAAGLRDEILFSPLALGELPDFLPGEPFDLIIVRRGLCAMPYPEARRIVRRLLLKLKIGGKIYVSVLGLHSELGDGYAGRETLVESRFGDLAAPLAAKYDIAGPVCLYSERNLFMLLLEAGASVLRTLTTTHGSVKGIAVRV